MSAYTPGPWKACRSHEDFEGPYFEIEGEDRAEYDARPYTSIHAASRCVVSCHDLAYLKDADAALIAAAPDLAEVLVKWRTFMRQNYKAEDISWWNETEAALAKAGVK